LLELRTAIWRL